MKRIRQLLFLAAFLAPPFFAQSQTANADLNSLAINKMDARDYQGALNDFDQIYRQQEPPVRLRGSFYYNRGLAHYFLGHYEAAAADYEKAMAMTPTLSRLLNYGELAKQHKTTNVIQRAYR